MAAVRPLHPPGDPEAGATQQRTPCERRSATERTGQRVADRLLISEQSSHPASAYSRDDGNPFRTHSATSATAARRPDTERRGASRHAASARARLPRGRRPSRSAPSRPARRMRSSRTSANSQGPRTRNVAEALVSSGTAHEAKAIASDVLGFPRNFRCAVRVAAITPVERNEVFRVASFRIVPRIQKPAFRVAARFVHFDHLVSAFRTAACRTAESTQRTALVSPASQSTTFWRDVTRSSMSLILTSTSW